MEGRVQALAAAYMDGHAVVDPKSIRSTCAYCGLEPLCRIGERTGADAEGRENESETGDSEGKR